MVRKTTMSRCGESEGGEGRDACADNPLTASKQRMKVEERMIDLRARQLQSTRSSSRDIAPVSGDHPPTTIEDNIVKLENTLMKLFARQLIHKHQSLQEYISNDVSRDDGRTTAESVAKIERELDDLIGFNMFLMVAGLEPRSSKALAEEGLTVDALFMMSPQELHSLMLKLNISPDDCQKLLALLNLLTYYYEKWQRGEKPTAGTYDIRRNSSGGRLNSLNSLASLDGRKDSCSSHMSTISPPMQNQTSRSSTPVTPLTPSSTYSPSLGLPHQNSTPVFPSHMLSSSGETGSPPFKRSNSTTYMAIAEQTTQECSSSSSSLNSDLSIPQPPSLQVYHYQQPLVHSADHTHSMIQQQQQQQTQPAKRKLSHKRSHSNPPLANIMTEVVPENSIPSYRSPSPPYYHSTAPPFRVGSQPSIVQQNVSNSPSTKSHPQMRRIMASTPQFSPNASGEVSLEPPARCNSEASGVKSSAPRQRRLSKETGTSTSMVDLPVIRRSIEHLDQADASFHHTAKSHSVPRLAHLVVNGEHDRPPQYNHSTSVPTSPRLPSNYNPTGVIGHKIDHRFVSHMYFGVHECDYCKKTLVMHGCKCKYCKYKCHKACSKLAPSTCGLPQDFLDYFRKNKHLYVSPSFENVCQVQSTPPLQQRPPLVRHKRSLNEQHLSNQALMQMHREHFSLDDSSFYIQDLNREPANSQYSPVIHARRQFAVQPYPSSPVHEVTSTSSLLEVPNSHHHPSPLHHHHHSHQHHHHSTSSSPSTSTQSSPCMTPVSPHSPMDHCTMDYPSFTSGYHSNVPTITTDDSTDEELEANIEPVVYYSPGSSSPGSYCDLTESIRVKGCQPRGLRPPALVVAAQSLPNLLMSDQQQLRDSPPPGGVSTSEDNLRTWYRKNSLVNTISTADSKTSTLVGSTVAEEEDDSSSYTGSELFSSSAGPEEGFSIRQRLANRQSVVDEWLIPFDDLKLGEIIERGAVAEVFKGNWHGEVTVKRFYVPHPTEEQIFRFREEVAVLKKTRHENLSLFMGACLTPPNFAIVTSLCKGFTLYKYIHQWGEVFSLERVVGISKQIAQAMGYLHARNIVHKDLNTKNIFLEKKRSENTETREKVVIADMGLSSLNYRMWCSEENSRGRMRILRTHLHYLAPEIMKIIGPWHTEYIYPFTEFTDIYAFGTILYELVVRKYPLATDALGFSYEPEVIINLVGSGKKQEFKGTEIPVQFKDIICACWNETPQSRPPFSKLLSDLTRLVRKHTPITRSPSHPINLSKSVDNLLFI